MPLCFLLALALLLPGCGDPKDQDTAPADGGTSDGGTSDGGEADGGTSDGGTSDGGATDGGATDGGATDGGATDGGATDGGATDGGATDGGTSDGGTSDGGTSDGGTSDGGTSDGGTEASFARVSAGLSHTCALDEAGGVTCWGSDDSGESSPPTESQVWMDAGSYYTCGVDGASEVSCWGSERWGAGTAPSGAFESVSAGVYHTCGVEVGAAVSCWGDDTYGQSSPPAVEFGEVSVGWYHTCGVTSSGTVSCWGRDDFGESSPPGGSFTSISAGGLHSCGLAADGELSCWGWDAYGQSSPPSGTYEAVTAGRVHSCAIDAAGAASCWGDDTFGQSTPPAEAFVSLGAGDYHTCGVRVDGGVSCWGDDTYGQSSPPGEEPELDPAVPVEDLLIVSADGVVYAWAAGASEPGELASLSAISSARRGEDGTLNLVVDGGGWVDLDPTTGAELSSLDDGSGSYVSCGGLSWTVDASELAGRDETGVVLSVDLSVFDDTVKSGAAVGRNLAASDGVVYVGFVSEYRAWTGGWGAVDCGTGEVLSATGVRSVRRMLIDHGALVILGHEEGGGGAGGVWAWDLETGDALVERSLGPTQAWGGRADGVQFAHYWASYIPTLGWWTGGGAVDALPTIPIGDAHDNFVVLFDGDDPAQIWAVGEDGELDAYDLELAGDSWTLVEREVPALGLVQLIDTPEP